MFKRIHIENYRSCRDVLLDALGPITALVGRNGAGKTNVLRAIEWISKVAVSTEPLGVEDTRRPGKPTRISVDVELSTGTFRYDVVRQADPKDRPPRPFTVTLEETLSFDAGGGWTTLIERRGEAVSLLGYPDPLRTAASSPFLPVVATVFPNDHPLSVQVAPLLSFFHSVRYYPLDEPSATGVVSENTTPIRGDQYAAWLSRYETTRDPGSSVVMRLVHMSLKKPEQFAELKSLLGSSGLGLISDIVVDDFELPTSGEGKGKEEPDASRRFYFVALEPSSARAAGKHAEMRFFDFNDLSAGTRRVIRILVSLIFDASAVMLLEQPEDSIHSGLMKKLVGLLRTNANPSQLIIATHSPSVFNRLHPSEIRLVTMSSAVTHARLLTPNELQAAEAFITADGSLADFLDTVED
jgi:predicted ATPase